MLLICFVFLCCLYLKFFKVLYLSVLLISYIFSYCQGVVFFYIANDLWIQFHVVRVLIFSVLLYCLYCCCLYTMIQSLYIFLAGSSWYLLCEVCREKYIKNNKVGKQNVSQGKNTMKRKSAYVMSLMSPTNSTGVDTHIVMKDNALFLLELASSANTGKSWNLVIFINKIIYWIFYSGINHQRRPSSTAMPSLAETSSSPPDYSTSFFPPPPPFQCLQSLGAEPAYNDLPFYEEVLKRHSVQDGFMAGPSNCGQRVGY